MELSIYGLLWIFIFNLFLMNNSIQCRKPERFPCQRVNRKKQCDKSQSFSFLWKIRRLSPSPPSYFFGTIHVPYTKVWDSVPNKAKSAFKNSRRIIFELDLMDSETVSSLSKCQLLPSGIKIVDVIPKDMYRRLKRHLEYIKFKIPLWITNDQKARGLYAEHLYNAITGNWERKKPIWIMLMINSLTENDIKSRGIPVLDFYLAQEAQRLSKEIGSVEKVEEQCIPLNHLNSTQVLFALNQTLLQHESIRRGSLRSKLTTDDLIRHYNCGNLNEVVFKHDTTQLPILKNDSYLIKSEDYLIAKRIDEYFRSELIVKRNKRMSQRVVNLLNSNPKESFFFVFGAGHFLGNDSIIEFMKQSGLEIIHVNESHRKKDHSLSYNIRCHNHHYLNARDKTSATVNNHSLHILPKQVVPPVTNPLLVSAASFSLPNNGWSQDRSRPPLYGQLPSNHYQSSKQIANDQSHQPVSMGPYMQPYGKNSWPATPLNPQYIQHSSSQHLSFNDLLLRTYTLNKNLSATDIFGNKLIAVPGYPSRQVRYYSPASYLPNSNRNGNHNNQLFPIYYNSSNLFQISFFFVCFLSAVPILLNLFVCGLLTTHPLSFIIL